MEDQSAMSKCEQQTTAAGDAIRPTPVATRKNPPSAEGDTGARGRVGFAESSETGDIPEIIGNDRGLYEGDLIGYFRTLIFHATNLVRPYHNLRHMLHVTWLCYQATEFYRDRLTPRQIRNLLIAALFHDFDHPGHPHPGADDPDGINIARAIAALRRHIAVEDRLFLPAIEALIEATHYPYAVAVEQLDLSAKIIRDADLAQALSPIWIQQVVIGLARERRVSPLEILKTQPAFLAALSFNTEWARERFPARLVAAKITEAERLLALLAGSDL
jgi:3'5'-cyclic nucleotide phosphodiesterase